MSVGYDETAIERTIRGVSSERAVTKVARKAAGEMVFPTTDEWLMALRQLDGVAVEFTMVDSLYPSLLWWDGGSYRAKDLPPGLEHKERAALDRHQAGALLQDSIGSVVSCSERGIDV